MSYLILIITPGISSVIISTFWRRKLKHRKLPKVIQQCDFGARVLNFYTLLRCQGVETLWRRELEEGEVKYNQEAEGTISMNLKVQMGWGLCLCDQYLLNSL